MGFQSDILPSKYLGAPLLEKSLHNVSWEYLLIKLEAKIANWTFHFLTLPGRILLIKSTLHSLPLYLFYILETPMKIIKCIQNL
jgi:hypothetical protein